jgi:biopolymer transport protein ExbB
VAEVFAHGVRKWGKPAVEVEQAIIDGGERQISQLRKHLRMVNGISTVSPLLGLLGTVFGMIKCFNEVANSSAMGKSEQLAGGIGEALVATAGGLIVAIPAIVLYMYFASQVDSLVMEMDALAQRVVNLISAEGLVSHHTGLPRIAAHRPKTIGTSAVKNSS